MSLGLSRLLFAQKDMRVMQIRVSEDKDYSLPQQAPTAATKSWRTSVMMRNFIGLTVIVIALLVCLIAVEVGLAVLAPVPDPYANHKNQKNGAVNQYIRSELPANYRVITEVDDDLPGMQGRHTFSTNSMGFRGDALAIPKPADEFRIFIVGGSTAECFYLDDSKAIHSVLQRHLQNVAPPGISIKVYNAGKSGDASDDHVSILAHRIVHLEPDLIVVFAGINDLTRSIYGYDYLHYMKEKQTRSSRSFLRSLTNDFPYFATEFQIPRRLYYAARHISQTDTNILEEIPLKTDYGSKVALRKSVPPTDERPRVDTESYGENIRTIVGMAKAHKIQLVLMTQQTTWNSAVDPEAKKRLWMLYRNGKTYREELMDEALESLNGTMRSIAGEYSIPLFDLTKLVPKSLEFFYDDVHFNVKGAMVAGTDLGRFIEPLVRAKSLRRIDKSASLIR